ncbi:MAG: deoxyribonuclease IV [Myxococcales bacterium]|jgi:deoxyribonuclease-4
MILGAHESIAGGLAKAFERAVEDTASSIQLFTKNARGWKAKPLDPGEAAAFREAAARTGIPVVAHATYLINLGAEEPELREKSVAGLADELARCETLGIRWLVLHPGGNADLDRGIELIADGLDEAIGRSGARTAGVLLETTAGQGASIGWQFEHLARILERSKASKRIAVCLDTCHLFAAGYELASPEGYAKTMRSLDGTLGIELVEAVHLNDCKKPLGSRVDRHEEIGEGLIGLQGFAPILTDPRLEKALGILETPEPKKYRENLEKLRSLLSPRPSRPRKPAKRRAGK